MIPSGETLYFSHSTSHSAAVIGGNIPVNGSHSVILRPDSVNRVNPPITTIPNTKAEQPNNHLGNDRGISYAFSIGAVRAAAGGGTEVGKGMVVVVSRLMVRRDDEAMGVRGKVVRDRTCGLKLRGGGHRIESLSKVGRASRWRPILTDMLVPFCKYLARLQGLP
jgi:hypothetical protein